MFAEGETVVRGAGELRVKESDRIMGVVEGLGGLGADIEATDDGFVVRGTGRLRGGTIDSRGDHRLAMLGAVAGLASEEGVEVEGFEAVVGLLPGFERDLERAARWSSLAAMVDRDRRARGGRQEHGGRPSPSARLHVPRLGRDVPRGRARPPA